MGTCPCSLEDSFSSKVLLTPVRIRVDLTMDDLSGSGSFARQD